MPVSPWMPAGRVESPSSLPFAAGLPSSRLSSQPAGTLSDVHVTGGPAFVGGRSPRTPSRPPGRLSYSRRNAWCDGWDVYVWLWSTSGESVLVASWMSSALSSQPAGTLSAVQTTGGPAFVGDRSPRTPSGPGWFLARVSTMNAVWSVTWSGVLGLPSGPSVRSGSSARSGTKTVPPLLNVWSTPWSKNCPKNVNHELYGGERPTSVVTFGMKSVLCDGVQLAGTPGVVTSFVAGSTTGSVSHGAELADGSWVRTGWPAAATAAGFVD